jgi:hypothetical protein
MVVTGWNALAEVGSLGGRHKTWVTFGIGNTLIFFDFMRMSQALT